jgi:hypothetical protein
VQIHQVLFKGLGVLPGRHLVQTGRTALSDPSECLPQKLNIDQMRQCGEYQLRIVRRLRRNSLKFRGYGW